MSLALSAVKAPQFVYKIQLKNNILTITPKIAFYQKVILLVTQGLSPNKAATNSIMNAKYCNLNFGNNKNIDGLI